MKYVNIILTLSVLASAVLGDHIVFKSKYSSSQVFRAFADTSVHGIIGLLSSILFFSYGINITTEAWFYYVLFCAAISSFIDIDHVITARSFHLKDVFNVNRRGIFHNSSLWIMLTASLLVLSHITKKLNVYLLTYMLIIAFTSHHIRDGNRRGIWFYPYGHTPALSTYLYMFLVCFLPSFLAWIYNNTKPIFRHNIVQYGIV